MSEAISNEVMALAQELAQKKAKELTAKKAEYATKYPHAIVETLRVLPHGHGSQTALAVDCKCTTCGETFGPVFTSDLFQKRHCPKCAKAAKAAAKATKSALLAKAMDLIAKGEVK